jgi:hypothetical protein
MEKMHYPNPIEVQSAFAGHGDYSDTKRNLDNRN